MISVNDIYQTIQGEGRYAGTPMVVLRLHGCTVGCSWCDTKQTWHFANSEPTLEAALGENRKYWTGPERKIAETVAGVANTRSRPIEWVMLTGGEPCEQEISNLVLELRNSGFKVNLETSGSASLPTVRPDWICVSPKMAFRKPLQTVLDAADEIKLVICTAAELERNLEWLLPLQKAGKHISLQAVWGSKVASGIVIDACMEYGFTLSLQTHKYLGID